MYAVCLGCAAATDEEERAEGVVGSAPKACGKGDGLSDTREGGTELEEKDFSALPIGTKGVAGVPALSESPMGLAPPTKGSGALFGTTMGAGTDAGVSAEEEEVEGATACRFAAGSMYVCVCICINTHMIVRQQ